MPVYLSPLSPLQAGEEHQRELAARDAAIAALQAEAAASQAAQQQEAEQLRQQLQGELAALQTAMAVQQAAASSADADAAAQLQQAQEQTGHLQSRVRGRGVRMLGGPVWAPLVRAHSAWLYRQGACFGLPPC